MSFLFIFLLIAMILINKQLVWTCPLRRFFDSMFFRGKLVHKKKGRREMNWFYKNRGRLEVLRESIHSNKNIWRLSLPQETSGWLLYHCSKTFQRSSIVYQSSILWPKVLLISCYGPKAFKRFCPFVCFLL